MSHQRANTDWFHQAKWGVFLHYLAELHLSKESLTPDAWNRLVDNFNVPGLVRQLQETGAGYCFLTIGQNSGYFCSPNATYDALVGHQPSRLSRRDLIADLADALQNTGIHLLVYLPSLAPANDAQAVERLRCIPDTDPRLTDFQRHWETIIREWSVRWGKRVHGWWIDGCYTADQMYRHPEPPNFRSFAAAMKDGNPDSLVAFNTGVRNPIISATEYEDYTAGEISNTLPTNGEEPCVIPVGRWVHCAQYHLLSFLGGCWAKGQPRFTDAMVAAYTRYVNSWGGVVTWDVPHQPDGLIPEAFVRQLMAFRRTPAPSDPVHLRRTLADDLT